MADHDHDAGSRGEAPRDPSRQDTAPMTYGDLGPGPYSGPGWGPLPPPVPPRPTLRDLLQEKRVQILGAALAGLVVGGVLGGGAVALWDRPQPMTSWERAPHWRDGPPCFEVDGRTICRLEPGGPRARVG